MGLMGLMGRMEKSGEAGFEAGGAVFVDHMYLGGFIQALECKRERFGRWLAAYGFNRVTKICPHTRVLRLTRPITTELFDGLFGNRHTFNKY